MGDRVAVLKNGVLQQFSSPTELYDRPANAFVAGFIGSPSMNLLRAKVVDDGVVVGSTVIPVERDRIARLHSAGIEEVTAGIRPEDFEIADEGVEAVVELVEELGSESYLYTRVPGTGNQVVARALVRTPARLADTVHLRKREGTVHLFHVDTGERVGD